MSVRTDLWCDEEKQIVREYLDELADDEKIDRGEISSRLILNGFTGRTRSAIGKQAYQLRYPRSSDRSRTTAKVARQHRRKDPSAIGGLPKTEAPPETIDVKAKGDSQYVESKSLDIRTVDDALAAAKVNLDDWDVERHVINSWEVTMGRPPKTYTNWQVKVWLKRKVPNIYQIIMEGVAEGLRGKSPKIAKPKKSKDGAYCAVVCLYDAHFGKLAWAQETDSNYDLKIARDRYLTALEKLLDQIRPFGVEQIYLPLGQDLLHIDNAQQTTAAGTPQDVDGRIPKIFSVACETVIRGIVSCANIAPTETLYVPGNHDPSTSYYLCKVAEAWFEGEDRVLIDTSPKMRKYRRFGCNLLGLTHGSEEPQRDLPTIMASECTDDWAASKYRQWLIGHTHKAKQTHYLAGDTFGGVEVRVIPSLCGTDQWHYKKGYVKSRRAAEVHLYSKDEGPVGYFAVNIPEG